MMQRGRRGNAGFMVALFIGVLLIAAAVAIDIGVARTRTNELQAALDAASLAGASATHVSALEVEARAEEVAGRNAFMGSPVSILGDVEIGDFTGGTFTISANGRDVRISQDANVPTLFAGIIGISSISMSISSTARGARMPVDCAIVGATYLELKNGLFDSYDSTVASYDLATAGSEANTCSNGDADIGGAITVNGDVAAGSTGTYNTTGQGNTVTGYTGSLAEDVALPNPCSFTQGCANPTDGWPTSFDNGGTVASYDGGVTFGPISDPALNVGQGAVKDFYLRPGVYQFSSISVSGNERIIIDPPGHVEIWVTGDVNLGGKGILNATNDPHDLTLISAGDMDLGGTSDLYALAYSMSSLDFKGNSDFYGALVAVDTLSASGSSGVHLDESLATLFQAETPEGPTILVQ